jgi:hypothetical protein
MSARPSLLSPVIAPFSALAREFADIVRNPAACIGGLAGSTACMAAAVGLALYGAPLSEPSDPDDDELTVEFLPGVLVRKGTAPNPDEIPEKPIVNAQKAVETPPDSTVTTNQDAPPDIKPPPKDPPKPPRKPARDPHDPNQQGEDSHINTDGNNPYKDPANAQELPGDPFGSPDGWSDRAEKGDPWATAVLAALNNLTVGSYAGLGQAVTYKFQLVLCADGRIDAVRTKQTTGKPDFDGQIRNALEMIKLPKAPPDVAKQLAGGCKKIPYVFTWSGKNSGGKVQ